MGFCLFNNIAIAAAQLVAEGERVLIIDWDAHHGNGTQEAFYASSEVLFISMHQFPYYPGSGAWTEAGVGPGQNTTLNLPFPAGTGGDAYRRAFDEAVVPAAEVFSPTWVLVSCGFDAHRDDPLTDLGLSAGDFGDLTERVLRLGAPGSAGVLSRRRLRLRRVAHVHGSDDLVDGRGAARNRASYRRHARREPARRRTATRRDGDQPRRRPGVRRGLCGVVEVSERRA